MINLAFTDWSDNPVITTLDTIAAPIDDIQFPTVTVCPGANEPSDNWAFLENLLDFSKFSCFGLDEQNCNHTEPLRKDFGFLMMNVKNLYIGFYNFYERKMMPIPNDLFHVKTGLHLNNLLWNFKEWTANGNVSFELEHLIKDGYSKGLSTTDIYKVLGYDYISTVPVGPQNDPYKNCNSSRAFLKYSECENIFLVKLLYELTSTKQGFGSLVRNYGHLESSHSFGLSKTINDLGLNQFDDICSILTSNEMKLHEYFTKLSTSIGFDETEAISLYDMPAIFGSIIGEDNWPLLMPQTFIYSRCMDYNQNMKKEFGSYLSVDDFDYSQSCLQKFYQYFKNISGKYHY